MKKDLPRISACLASLSLLILSGCSTDEPVGTFVAALESENGQMLQIEVLSSKPWLVTGGDALIEISNLDKNSASNVQLILNNRTLKAELVNTGRQKWQVRRSSTSLSWLRAFFASAARSPSPWLTIRRSRQTSVTKSSHSCCLRSLRTSMKSWGNQWPLHRIISLQP